MSVVPQGKVWILVEGVYENDLFEVDASTPEAEITEARRQYKARYPDKCVIKRVGHMKPTDTTGREL